MNQSASKVKRSRKSAPKSRQGCITCKSRHVKCDEAKPFCKRCAKAGRTCQGYPQEGDELSDEVPKAAAESSKRHTSKKVSSTDLTTTSTSRNNDLSDPAGLPVRLDTFNGRELRFLEYFYKRTAPAISGYFDAKFYNRVLLQSGQSEPAVRHAMIAAAAMHEHFESFLVPSFSESSGALTKDDKPSFALYQYNKAISAINQQLSSGPGSIESVLMCCLLFVCLECLRGDTASAVSHLKAGGNIIANWKLRNRKVEPQSESAYSSVDEIPKSTDSSFVNEHLVPIFERLSTHVDGAGRIASSEYKDLVNPNVNQENPVTEAFKDLEEARNAVMNLGSVCTRFIRGVAMTKYVQTPSDDDARVVAGLRRKLEHWETYMENFCVRCPEQRNTRRAIVIRVQHRLFQVALSTGLALEQSANDIATQDYEDILEKAETLIGDPDARLPASEDEEELSIFSFEEGVTPACFYVASKCRVPHLRRKAIELLRKGPARQGIWNSVLLARVAERIAYLEENFTSAIQSFDADLLQPPVDPLREADEDPALSGLPLTPESLAPECAVFDQLDQIDQADHVELPPTSSVSHQSQLPPERARIHHADIKESVDGTPHEHVVTFFRKPNGLYEDWEIWTEHIRL